MKNKDKYIIYQPTKSAMQSGLSNTKKWCLINSEINESFLSSKFQWNGSTNPERKIDLFFSSLDEAKRFAKKNNYNFDIIMPKKRSVLKKTYAENFIRKR